tara:strand:+ start:1386 stop:1838 length:453 start_codon:yes stop_codon:yes gene_type:complete
MYSAYDQSSSRSPGSHRNQPQTTLHRMPSRQFDAYAPLPQGNLYTPDDHARSYEPPRNYDRLTATVHGGGGYGYDMGARAGWNTNAFSQNGLGSLGGAAAARMKSQQRGRSALPSVRHLTAATGLSANTSRHRDGWISLLRVFLALPCQA